MNLISNFDTKLLDIGMTEKENREKKNYSSNFKIIIILKKNG